MGLLLLSERLGDQLSVLGAAGLTSTLAASLGGEQSKQTKVVLPRRRLKEP
jgi:hypothetical protein